MKKLIIAGLLVCSPTFAAEKVEANPAAAHVLYFLSASGVASLQDFNNLATCKAVLSEITYNAYMKDRSGIVSGCLPK